MPKTQEETISDRVTIREVYNLIDNRFNQVSASVDRLEAKFDMLESGRVSGVEKEVSNIQGRLMIVPILISIAVGVFTLILNFLLYGGSK